MKTTETARTIMCLAMVAVLCACTTTGHISIAKQTKSSVSKQIIEGRTTKAQIISAFGNTGNVSFTDSGDEVWTYKFSRVVPDFTNYIPIVRYYFSGANVTTKEIVVIFNQAGVVSKYTMDETKNRVEYDFKYDFKSPRDDMPKDGEDHL